MHALTTSRCIPGNGHSQGRKLSTPPLFPSVKLQNCWLRTDAVAQYPPPPCPLQDNCKTVGWVLAQRYVTAVLIRVYWHNTGGPVERTAVDLKPTGTQEHHRTPSHTTETPTKWRVRGAMARGPATDLATGILAEPASQDPGLHSWCCNEAGLRLASSLDPKSDSPTLVLGTPVISYRLCALHIEPFSFISSTRRIPVYWYSNRNIYVRTSTSGITHRLYRTLAHIGQIRSSIPTL